VTYCGIEGDGQRVVDIRCRCSRSQSEVVLDPTRHLSASGGDANDQRVNPTIHQPAPQTEPE